MRYELKSVGVWAFVKVSFFVNLAFGFLFGLFFALIIVPMMSFSLRMSGMGDEYGNMPSLGVLALVLPFMFALAGAVFNTILGAIVVLLYNLLANLLGGLELDFAPVGEFELAPQPAVRPQANTSQSVVTPSSSPMPPPPPRPTAPAVAATEMAPQPEIRPETLEETPPAPAEPDEDGPRPDET